MGSWENVNPTAVIVVVLAFAWFVVALPNIVHSRHELAEARTLDRSSAKATVLRRGIGDRPRTSAHDASQARSIPLLTSRKAPAEMNDLNSLAARFDASRLPIESEAIARPDQGSNGEFDSSATHDAAAEGRSQRRRRKTVLFALLAVTVLGAVLAAATALPWVIPVIFLVLFAGDIVILRRAEVRRLAGMHRVHDLQERIAALGLGADATRGPRRAPTSSNRTQHSDESPSVGPVRPELTDWSSEPEEIADDEHDAMPDRPAPFIDPRAWMPVPVPTPHYLLKDGDAAGPDVFDHESLSAHDDVLAAERLARGEIALGSSDGNGQVDEADPAEDEAYGTAQFDLDAAMARRRAV